MKRLYTVKQMEELVVRDRKLLQWIGRETDFTSTQIDYPIVGANNQRFGSDFEMAKSGSGAGGTVYGQFNVPQRQYFAFGTLSGQAIANFTYGNQASHFINGLKNEYASLLEQMGQELNKQAFGGGKGLIAQNSSGTASPILLSDPSMARHFSVGMA